MRTTVDLDDALLANARERAAQRGISLTRFIEEALAAAIAPRPETRKPFKLRWKPHSGRFLGGVDLADRNDLYEVMEGRK